MVAEQVLPFFSTISRCSLAKISMVAELTLFSDFFKYCCSLAKISMVAEQKRVFLQKKESCSLAKISMVAERLVGLVFSH